MIDQGEAPSYYFEKFPEDNPVFGFITWRWILTPGFDHMFSSPVFLGLLALLATSLMACTYTTQLPMVKVARRYGRAALVYATCLLLGKPISESLNHGLRHQLRVPVCYWLLQMVVHTFRRKNTEAGIRGLASPSIHSGFGSHLDGCWI